MTVNKLTVSMAISIQYDNRQQVMEPEKIGSIQEKRVYRDFIINF